MEWGVMEPSVNMQPSVIFQTLQKLGISRMFVYRTINRYNDTSSVEDHKRSGRPRALRTAKAVNACIKAKGAITSEILTKLKVSIETLPQKCQHILQQTASNQLAVDVDKLDSISFSLRQSRGKCDQLEDEYEILKLKQKNAELQLKIDRNNKFLEDLKRELACSKESLAKGDPNPDNIQDYIRQWKQKVGSYEESCEKAKMKFSKLAVPDSVHPMSLLLLIETRDALRRDAESLRLRADDVTLARQARDAFTRLRK